MQISKRINSRKKYKTAQNLIEFVYVLPILILTTLVIFEVGLFWQDVNAIYNLNAEINANAALEDYSDLELNDPCPAAVRAQEILENKDSMISLNNPSYVSNIVLINGQPQGIAPFALYKITSTNTVEGKVDKEGNSISQVTLWVDCRNPFEEGITTQLMFYHKTLIMKATIPRFEEGERLVIIPENIFIASPKLNTITHY